MDLEYAVIYQSITGNTEKVAKVVFEAIESDNKHLVKIGEADRIPYADVYFVGFNIHNDNCSIEVIDCLEQITNGYIALFSSCGYFPTKEYIKRLENKFKVWLPEEAEYMGMFVCQGCVQEEQKVIMLDNMRNNVEVLSHMFEIGDTHPDNNDLEEAARFSKGVQLKVTHKGNIPIL